MLITEIDNFFIDMVNNICYKSENAVELFKRLDILFAEEFDCYFYTILLLDDNDNNFYIEHTKAPVLTKLKHKLFSLFENKILRRLYGFGVLKDFTPGDNNYISIGDEYVELSNAIPIEYDGRIVGFLTLHDKPLTDTEFTEKLKYTLKQVANSIVIFKRLAAERELNMNYITNLKILKFLNSLLKESSIESIFYRILNNMYEILDAEAGCVAMRTDDKWITPAELGINDKLLEKLKFKDGMKILDFATQVQQIYNVNEYQINEQFELADLRVNLKSLLMVPIIITNDCNNVVVIVNYHKEIDERIMIHIQKLAEISATAIQNYDIIADEDASFPEKEAKLNNLRDKFIKTLETLLDEIELS
ncbi:MAG TPA: hypothetical protein PKY81_12595 [bacterium]|nr:hypothetical protein [bacterium]HPN31786.1 hypothetical protein [bacterium]